MIDDQTSHLSAYPQLSGRVGDVQSRVREHTAHGGSTPEELAAALRSAGLRADVVTDGPGGRPLVRVDEQDIALHFAAEDGALVVVDVRRHT